MILWRLIRTHVESFHRLLFRFWMGDISCIGRWRSSEGTQKADRRVAVEDKGVN